MEYSGELLVMVGLGLFYIALTFIGVIRNSLVSDYRNLILAEDCVHGTDNYGKLPSYLRMYLCVWIPLNSYAYLPTSEEVLNSTYKEACENPTWISGGVMIPNELSI